MHEKRPGHFVLRASKVLANSSWIGKEYKLVYPTSAEMMRYLEEVPVGIVVIDNSVSRSDKVSHHALLKQTLLAYPERWEPLGAYPLIKAGVEYNNGLLLYRLRGHETKSPWEDRTRYEENVGPRDYRAATLRPLLVRPLLGTAICSLR